MDKKKISSFLWSYLNDVRVLDIKKSDFLLLKYLESHLDSFDIIQFIMAIESEFDIILTPEMTESNEFRTIEGLIAIIINCKK